MCRHCRYNLDKKPLIEKYWLSVSGNKKEALKAISKRLNAIRKERKALQRCKEFKNIPYLDYERDALSFAACVLNYNYQRNNGWKTGGWMNGCDTINDGAHLFVV